ncbi:RidA family protein [Micrococcus terreus]|uniref:Enamine deaminase RidA, house cleaning of reactive enamine intermediates, YjgF/YER057c/UK114 family n=1 Tax=Micrococcus terreus TaxID=574650 RepID=A0A1I7MT20_9MICC|nr:RidA family protein [Micrococcus terreus]SFV25070.1 Enamine deaminase RidA, house cleaning of reactive enamine intermediates, YjgF/YER057c/UK114 family [Micrococcus terreus]
MTVQRIDQRASGHSVLPESMIEDYQEFHFSPGFEAGGLLFISGQIGVDASGGVPDQPAEQARCAFERIGTILAEAGLGFEDIASITSHHVGEVTEIFGWFPEVKDSFLAPPYPAWTALGVSGLAIPGIVVEISAIAKTRANGSTNETS